MSSTLAAAPLAAQAEPAVIIPPPAAEAPVASGEISSDAKLPAGDQSAAAETPALQEAPPAAAETRPAQETAPVPAPAAEAAPASAEITAAQMAKAKENPLAPESLAAITEALKDKGKFGDGKFSTPAPFRDALEASGFKFPGDMESEELKKLHSAYKKSTAK